MSAYYSLLVRPMWAGFKLESAAFWWLCIYMFLEYVRPASLYPAIDVAPWTQISGILICLSLPFDKSIKWVKSGANAIMILFGIVTLISSALAFSPAQSWENIDIPLTWVALYFLVVAIVNTERRLFVFTLLFLVLNFKMSQHGFFSFVGRGFSYASWGVSGSPGWFRNAGDFGIAMTIFVPLSAAFAISLWSYLPKWKRYILAFFPVSGVITIIATSSRGAQLGAIAIAAWFMLKTKKPVRAIITLLIVGVSVYALTPDAMLEEYDVAGDDRTSEDRLEHWKFGIEIVKDRPILGIGYNNWLLYCRYKNPEQLGVKSGCRVPHNSFIDAAAELGMTGFSLYIVAIFFVFILNAKTRRIAKAIGNEHLVIMSHGLDGALVGYLISTIFFSVFFAPFFWVHLAMCVSFNNVVRKLAIQASESRLRRGQAGSGGGQSIASRLAR